MRPTAENPAGRPLPEGVIEAFWRYESALMADDVEALDAAFVSTPAALRTDARGTRVGEEIARFRRERGGAPARSVRRLVAVEVVPHVVVTAATTVDRDERQATITQVWAREAGEAGEAGEWRIAAAHVGAPAHGTPTGAAS